MSEQCSHIDQIKKIKPTGPGCVECLATHGEWVHLRLCLTCGHVGCCDSSPNQHATKHAHSTHHPIIQSYEPNEDWLWCYQDEVMFEIPAMKNSPSHPPDWSPGPPKNFKHE